MKRSKGKANPINKENIPSYYRKRESGMTDEEIIAEYESGLRTSGTSIFDPVLCELAYIWFCPPGGRILDPFAGGSVRGIVAAYLGREYVGVDLSERQTEANREQAEAILGQYQPEAVSIKVSGAWARHCFSCEPEYITAHCHGRCCEGTGKILVSLLPEEAERHESLGYAVVDGKLQADPATSKCPHKDEGGLCKVHRTELKPFGCIASPFTLGKGRSLIIRQRYTRLNCHKQGAPAYKTFRASLDLIFGEGEASRIIGRLDAGAESVQAAMPQLSYKRMRYLDKLKHGTAKWSSDDEGAARWIVGDSRNVTDLAPGPFDFLFTCPPYYDLEVYSDDPRDISTAGEYDEFLEVYRDIIRQGVGLLSDDRFACIVVGDVRGGKHGYYHGFVEDTMRAFEDAGARKYNEAILITAVGSLPIRVGGQFEAGRKLGKTHQNVLVFCKGDPRKATEACGAVDVAVLEGADNVPA